MANAKQSKRLSRDKVTRIMRDVVAQLVQKYFNR